MTPYRRWSWRSGDVAIWSMLLFFFTLALFIVYLNISFAESTPPPVNDRIKPQ